MMRNSDLHTVIDTVVNDLKTIKKPRGSFFRFTDRLHHRKCSEERLFHFRALEFEIKYSNGNETTVDCH